MLWMRTYPNTIWTNDAIRGTAQSILPRASRFRGSVESSCAKLSVDGHYHYQASRPALAINQENRKTWWSRLIPVSWRCFADPESAVENLPQLDQWVCWEICFFEAADFTPSR